MTERCVRHGCDAVLVEVERGRFEWSTTMATPVDHEHVAAPIIDLAELEEHESYLREVRYLRQLRTAVAVLVAVEDSDEVHRESMRPHAVQIVRNALEDLEPWPLVIR